MNINTPLPALIFTEATRMLHGKCIYWICRYKIKIWTYKSVFVLVCLTSHQCLPWKIKAYGPDIAQLKQKISTSTYSWSFPDMFNFSGNVIIQTKNAQSILSFVNMRCAKQSKRVLEMCLFVLCSVRGGASHWSCLISSCWLVGKFIVASVVTTGQQLLLVDGCLYKTKY